jgi:transcriptional regulator with XRE-family HTH domain
MARKRISHYNNLKDEPPEDDGTVSFVKKEFARRLTARMLECGFDQSDLARRIWGANKKTGAAIGRDRISHYCRGMHLPQPLSLQQIAKALNCAPGDLMPEQGVPSTVAPASGIQLVSIDNDRCQFRLNRPMSIGCAMDIIARLKQEDAGEATRSETAAR